jgi:hypothetical protein
MQERSKVGDRVRVSRDLPGETHTRIEEEAMDKTLMKTVIRFGALVVSLGWASWLTAAKPESRAHAVQATVADRTGDSILSDGGGQYTDGVDAEARIWDFTPPAIDHLYFKVSQNQGRYLKLSIPDVTGGVETCQVGTLQPNQNSDAYSFYDVLPVGNSTADFGKNFHGTFRCYDNAGRNGWTVTYEPQCIVITHGQYGNPFSNPLEWTFVTDAPCLASVTKVVNRKVAGTWVGQSVPFQIVATELP